MARKVITIESAKLPKDVPLLSMSPEDLENTFRSMGSGLDEGILNDARTTDRQVCLISVVLSKQGAPDRIVCAYDEYGDEDHVELCEELVEEAKAFLHSGESLRVATFDVDLTRCEPFNFPSKKIWDAREKGGWRTYQWLYEARGLQTVVVVWLTQRGGGRKIVTWDVDHGDGGGMFERSLELIESMKWNRLLHKSERLSAVSYVVPMSALTEHGKDDAARG